MNTDTASPSHHTIFPLISEFYESDIIEVSFLLESNGSLLLIWHSILHDSFLHSCKYLFEIYNFFQLYQYRIFFFYPHF